MNHVIRLGTHAEKEYFQRATAWYDEVLINANLLDFTASSTSYFVFELGRRDKGFFIDPVTYAFALAPSHLMSKDSKGNERPKQTFLSLAKEYGLVGESATQIPHVESSTLQDPSLQHRFCSRVLAYQQKKIHDTLQANSDFISDTIGDIRPTRLVAPYFYLPQEDAGWYSINTSLIRLSVEIAQKEFGRGAWGVICFDGLILDRDDLIDEICRQYGELQCEGYALWVADFDEPRATGSQIRGLMRLVEKLKEKRPDTPILSMYAGYFTALLKWRGVSGISHGVGYGERRGVVPVVGGGLPPARYYLPPIHEEISIPELDSVAENYSSQQFEKEICGCVICQRLLLAGVQDLIEKYMDTEIRPSQRGSRGFPTPAVYRLTKFHFLHNRHLELRELEGAAVLGNLTQSLSEAYGKFGPKLGYSRVTFLDTWSKALQ